MFWSLCVRRWIRLPVSNTLPPTYLSHPRSADAFETFALHTLTGGGSFVALNLWTNKREQLRFPPSERHYSSDHVELCSAVAAAKASKFPAIDAILPGNVLVNVTLDRSHELLLQGKRAKAGIIPLCHAMGLGSVTFVWAVPHDRFDGFCRKAKPAKLVGAESASSLHVEQYLLQVPLPPWAGSSGSPLVGAPPSVGGSGGNASSSP